MPINSRTNLYPGVNAHLNSFLQQPGGGWESFHARHIEDIASALDRLLPPTYYVLSEKSLQISYAGSLEPGGTLRPDVSIFQLSSSTASHPTSASSTPTASLPLAETLLDDDEALMSVVIFDISTTGGLPGKPVTRIELLSPSNKPPVGDYRHYRARRQHTLNSGMAMVEIDYLHQQPPVLPRLPSYPHGDANASPYTMAVSSPYPTPHEGQFLWYGVPVDAPLPVVPIPLGPSATVALDMQALYNQTFAARRAFSLLVDYAAEPVAFERYRPDDRDKIRDLLERIRREHASEGG